MYTGNIDAQIDSLMQVCYDSGELASAATSITISGLDGDSAEEYELIVRAVNGYNGAINYSFYFNADTTNYGYQQLYGSNASKGASRNTEGGINDMGGGALASIFMLHSKIQAKSGQVRTCINKSIYPIATTTVETVKINGHSWNDTASNITSMTIIADQANGLGIGSRVILLKKVSNSGLATGELDIHGVVKNAWQEVYTTSLLSTASSVTISGLTGNSDVLYRLRARVVAGRSGDTNYNIALNNDTAANYGGQIVYGANTAVTAYRGTTNTGILATYFATRAVGREAVLDGLLYAKSGYLRTGIGTITIDVNGTTIEGSSLDGGVWNNTADEITLMVFTCDQTGGLGIGTEISLERLNL
jgi:hypothetical protein